MIVKRILIVEFLFLTVRVYFVKLSMLPVVDQCHFLLVQRNHVTVKFSLIGELMFF